MRAKKITPIVDLSGDTSEAFCTGQNDPALVSRLQNQISEKGFVYVRPSSATFASIEELRRYSLSFFLQPTRLKRKVSLRPGAYRGWTPSGVETADGRRQPDIKEILSFGNGGKNEAGWYAKNRFPEGLPEIERSVGECLENLSRTMDDISEVLASAFPEPFGHASDLFREPLDILNINYYQPSKGPSSPTMNVGSHKDFGFMTLISPMPGGSSGLQLSIAGRWRNVNLPAGTLLLVFGELAEAWTQSIIHAPVHRVNGFGASLDRVSLVYFRSPNPAQVIPTSRRSRTVGEFLLDRLRSVRADRRPRLDANVRN